VIHVANWAHKLQTLRASELNRLLLMKIANEKIPIFLKRLLLNLLDHALSEMLWLIINLFQIQLRRNSADWAFKLAFFIWLLWRPISFNVYTLDTNLVVTFKHYWRRAVPHEAHVNFTFQTLLLLLHLCVWLNNFEFTLNYNVYK
jgi:hypothetical protein